MRNSQTLGGWAALICAATYLFGIAILVAFLEPAGFSTLGADAEKTAGFLTSHHAPLSAWYLGIYVVNALALVVLVVALRARLSDGARTAADLAAAFGLVWATLVLGAGMVANVGLSAAVDAAASDPARAAAIWQTTTLVENGLGGGNEIAGGVWVVVVSIAGLQSRALPTLLNWFGLLIGASGLATIVPAFEPAGMIFGLGFIAWFAWAGIALLRTRA